MENLGETIGAITALLVACGVIFTAIFAARNNTEKTLQEHIKGLYEDIAELKKERDDADVKWEARCSDFKSKNDELFALYNAEKERGDRLEKRIASLVRRTKKKG